MRNLAKSLHTITALVNVAKWIESHTQDVNPTMDINEAASILWLDGMPDVYGLKEKAAAQLKRQIETNDTEELNTPNVRALLDERDELADVARNARVSYEARGNPDCVTEINEAGARIREINAQLGSEA